MKVETKDGKAPFWIPGLATECETYYKVYGDLSDTTKAPLIVLHGGPGAGHAYLLALAVLADSFPIIVYDQIGCGASTLLKEKDGDENFWTVELFCSELNSQLAHLHLADRQFDLYGHSWGAMFAGVWAADTVSGRVKNLRRLILSSGTPSMEVAVEATKQLIKRLPSNLQEIIERSERERYYENPRYKAACEAGMDCLEKSKHVYNTMQGPSELTIVGSLRGWTSIPGLRRIAATTLLMNGTQDTAQDFVLQPYFDLIPHVKWVMVENAGHMTFCDQKDRYLQHIRSFLTA